MSVEEVQLKRNLKDEVFHKLFLEKDNQRKLIEELFPDSKPIDESKLKTIEVNSVFVRDFVNDLAVMYGSEMVFMAECQTQWDPHLPFRFALYTHSLMLNYIKENQIDIHSADFDEDSIPGFNLALIYLGEDKSGDIDIHKVSPKANSDLVIHVFNKGPVENGIVDQYIHFGKTHVACIRRNKGDPNQALAETISICNRNGWLTDFIKEHEKELMEITMAFYTQEEIDRNLMAEERRKGYKEGVEKGIEKGIEKGEAKERQTSTYPMIRRVYSEKATSESVEDARRDTISLLGIDEKELDEALNQK